MKKIKQWKNFGKVFEAAEDDIIELEDVCAWMSDRVDSLEIKPNGESSYNINIAYNRQLHSQELSNIVQNAEEMNELTTGNPPLYFSKISHLYSGYSSNTLSIPAWISNITSFVSSKPFV